MDVPGTRRAEAAAVIFSRVPTLPRCLRCKLHVREPVRPNDAASLADAERAVARLVQGGAARLDRGATARLFLAHRHLALASKGRHCCWP